MKIYHTENAPKAVGPYSQSVETSNLFFTSGQIAIDPVTNKMTEGNIQEQTLRVCKNLEAILKARGISFEHVVKTTCFLRNMNDFQAFNEVYKEFFVSMPARSCVEVSSLPKGALVEIELIAEV